jgi:hypothetical protein
MITEWGGGKFVVGGCYDVIVTALWAFVGERDRERETEKD